MRHWCLAVSIHNPMITTTLPTPLRLVTDGVILSRLHILQGSLYVASRFFTFSEEKLEKHQP